MSKPVASIKRPLIHIPTAENALLEKIVELINTNEEVQTLWKVMNVNAIDRLGMTDHGPVHFQIVSNIALRLCRILKSNKVEMSITKNFGLSSDYAEVVIFLASLFHDFGMSIERDGHEEFSLILSNTILRETLAFMPTSERVIVTSEVLHAIISHRSGGNPLTIEAGIVRVADALDMSKGRSRIPYEAGKVDIHSVSAAAIENIEIEEGVKKPIQITISMNNSAGVFQVDELLKKKLKGSGIEQYVEVKAVLLRETEKSLVKEFSL
ncbi:MAG TPA: HD domain-containing protein [Patescibacteria group bacterium]|nr:HD domain-containing protein [Patescibacteria group bacterium]